MLTRLYRCEAAIWRCAILAFDQPDMMNQLHVASPTRRALAVPVDAAAMRQFETTALGCRAPFAAPLIRRVGRRQTPEAASGRGQLLEARDRCSQSTTDLGAAKSPSEAVGKCKLRRMGSESVIDSLPEHWRIDSAGSTLVTDMRGRQAYPCRVTDRSMPREAAHARPASMKPPARTLDKCGAPSPARCSRSQGAQAARRASGKYRRLICQPRRRASACRHTRQMIGTANARFDWARKDLQL